MKVKMAVTVLLAMMFAATPGWAVLGEYENSVASDQQVMRGQIRAIARQGYSLKEITAPNGAVVREFVSPAGLVFGVSWQGPRMPNLQQLLGSYFPQVEQASQARKRRGGPLIVRTDKLVVVSAGHMRAFHGIAYAPDLLPKNVSAEVVR